MALSAPGENRKAFILCLAVACATFQYGFDTGIVNGFQATQGFLRVFGYLSPETQKYRIETVRLTSSSCAVASLGACLTSLRTQVFQQLITSLLQVGLITASVIIGPFSQYFGRRAGFAVCSVLSFIAITIQILVTSKGRKSSAFRLHPRTGTLIPSLTAVYLGRLLLGISNGGYVK